MLSLVLCLRPLRPLWRLLCAVTLIGLTGCATLDSATIAPYVGTYRVDSGGEDSLHLKVEPGGDVEMVVLAEGRRVAGRALFGTLNGRSGFSGLLATGEAFAIGPHQGRPVLTLGMRLLPLASLPPQQYGVAPARPMAERAGAAPGAGGGSLAGLRLSMAKGGNGYFVERSYDFCADGRVFTRVAESQLSQLGSGVTERKDQGSWRMAGSTLQLSLARGGMQTMSVQRTEPTVFRLDGVGYAAERGRC